MNTDFYKNFIVVAQTGNITVAAEKLQIAQSALSKQLNAMEKHYGIALLDKKRGRRQVVLTDAGLDFLRRAQELCQAEESISLDMQAYKSSVGGTLRLSVSQVTVNDFMEKYILPFAKLYPDVNFQLHEETVAEQLKSLQENVVDVAYANAPLPETANFICKPLARERFYAVYKKNHVLHFNPGNKLDLVQLKNLRLSCNYGCLSLLRKLCKACGFAPEIRFIATTGLAAVKFAEAGDCVAVVSSSSCQHLPKGMTRCFIDDEELAYAQTLFWSATNRQTPIAKLFLEFVFAKS